ncbi:MAG: BrnT family toxin [Acidobacteria bacterium]|nr:BrnT family toxin [Acidobacteriota bacterium]
MVNWRRFTPSNFEYDFQQDKLAAHGVTFNEAVECFFSDFEIRRNKRYRDRYQLIGRTLGGRRLKIIFQLKPHSVVRIITGWPV